MYGSKIKHLFPLVTHVSCVLSLWLYNLIICLEEHSAIFMWPRWTIVYMEHVGLAKHFLLHYVFTNYVDAICF